MPLLHIVDDRPYLGAAMRLVLRPRTDISMGIATSSWEVFSRHSGAAPGCVLVTAELLDPVPTVLKVRLLRRKCAQAVVIMNRADPAHEQRLREAGAFAVVTRDVALRDLIVLCGQAMRGILPPSTAQSAPTHLTDRELQVACVYCGLAAPTGRTLAEYLGVSPQTIRVHLRQVRAKYRAFGETSLDRLQLRHCLVNDGWLHF